MFNKKEKYEKLNLKTMNYPKVRSGISQKSNRKNSLWAFSWKTHALVSSLRTVDLVDATLVVGEGGQVGSRLGGHWTDIVDNLVNRHRLNALLPSHVVHHQLFCVLKIAHNQGVILHAQLGRTCHNWCGL